MKRHLAWMSAACLLFAGAALALKSQALFDARSDAIEDYDNADDGGMMTARELKRMKMFYRVTYGRAAADLRPWHLAAASCTSLGLLFTCALCALELRRLRGQARQAVTFAALCVIALPARSFANAEGISGFSGTEGVSCGECHEGNGKALAHFTGPRTLAPGQRCDYALTVSGVNGYYAGIDVGAERTSVKLGEGQGTRLLNGEIVHTVARSLRDGPVPFVFTVTAPPEPGRYRIYAGAVVGDGNGRVTGDAVADASLTFDVSASGSGSEPCEWAAAASPSPPSGPATALPTQMMMSEAPPRNRPTLPSLGVIFLLTAAALVRIVKSG